LQKLVNISNTALPEYSHIIHARFAGFFTACAEAAALLASRACLAYFALMVQKYKH
jgi:hypothetical protein